MTRALSLFLAAVCTVLAILAIIVAVIYFHDTAKNLPGFLPGHAHRGHYKETHKAVAALVVGVVLLVVGGVVSALGRRRPRAAL